MYKDDEVLLCDTSSGPVTINLLNIVSSKWSTTYKLYIVDTSSNAATNNITINAGSGQKINNQSSFTINTNGGYGIIQISGNTQYIISSSQMGDSGPQTPFSGTNWSFVYGNGSWTENATQLQNAYTSAKSATPNGSPLSANNRFTIMVGAGYYEFSSNFVMDADFVDIVSITGNTDVIFNGAGTLSITGNDVFVKGVSTTTKAFTIATGLASLVLENCIGGDNSFKAAIVSGTFINCTGGTDAFGGANTASGIFINCTGGDNSFAGTGTASGTFTNCTGGTSAFGGFGVNASGTFTNCTGGQYAFGGGGGTASGTFRRCTASNYSFGGGGSGTANGTFIDCEGLTQAFGGDGTAGGIFVNCIGGDEAFGGGENGGNIASGNFQNCKAGDNAFGGGDNGGGTASGVFNNCVSGSGGFGGGDTGVGSGTFTNCTGGDESFGNLTCSGSFTNCVGGNESFGGHTGGTLTGKLYWCRLTSGTYRTVSGGGRTIYCIDGNNNTNNQ